MNTYPTITQIEDFLKTVEQLKAIEISLIQVRGLVHHESEAWLAFLACQKSEWLKQANALSEMVGESNALALARRLSPLAKPL